LEAKDAPICNNLWTYKNENSELWIKSLIKVHGGYALTDKNSNEMLSFAIINDHLAIGVLVTIKKAQRKGYGEIIVKYLAKKLSQKGFYPHVYINKENEKGFKLFHKLGFIKIGDSNWITVLS
jgi:L-amino acid N-acyltransferase YncA